MLALASVQELDAVGPTDLGHDGADPALVPGMRHPMGIRRLDVDHDLLADLELAQEAGHRWGTALANVLRERAAAARSESLRTLDHLYDLRIVNL